MNGSAAGSAWMETPRGDDFDAARIEAWFAEEAAHHDRFIGGRAERYWSIYEYFNRRYAFDRHLGLTGSTRLLSFGCAEGLDLERLYRRQPFELYGVEASATLMAAFRERLPGARIVRARSSGDLDFPSDFFHYVTVLGVLHHVPNVTHVVSELVRVLRPGGKIVIREPTSGMRSRPGAASPGLSPNERGIPVAFLADRLERSGAEVLEVSSCYYGPLMRLLRAVPPLAHVPGLVYALDRVLCRLPRPEAPYWRTRLRDRLAPSAAYLVASKLPGGAERRCTSMSVPTAHASESESERA
jgi:SAM-dependent methyltransferase